MSKNKKPPKRKQRSVPVNPVNLVIDGMKRLTEADRASILLPARRALQALMTGEGTPDAWRTVCGTLNVASMVDRAYFSRQYAKELAEACYAHARCGVRAYGYAGPELQAVKFALDLHMEHLGQLTFRELTAAVDQVNAARKPALPNRRNPRHELEICPPKHCAGSADLLPSYLPAAPC